MLTEGEESYLFQVFKNALYADDKATIEELYPNIEKEEIRITRDLLLREAEKTAIINARRAVRKIKNQTIDQLLQQYNEDKTSSLQTFGDELFAEITMDLRNGDQPDA